eukprot:g1988.t1
MRMDIPTDTGATQQIDPHDPNVDLEDLKDPAKQLEYDITKQFLQTPTDSEGEEDEELSETGSSALSDHGDDVGSQSSPDTSSDYGEGKRSRGPRGHQEHQERARTRRKEKSTSHAADKDKNGLRFREEYKNEHYSAADLLRDMNTTIYDSSTRGGNIVVEVAHTDYADNFPGSTLQAEVEQAAGELPAQRPKRNYLHPPASHQDQSSSDFFTPGNGQKVWLKTFGCSHNASDSEIMAGLLTAEGYVLTEDANDADVLIVNSCTVKNPSQDAAVNLVKKSGAQKPVILTGCVSQADPKLVQNLEKKLHGSGESGAGEMAKVEVPGAAARRSSTAKKERGKAPPATEIIASNDAEGADSAGASGGGAQDSLSARRPMAGEDASDFLAPPAEAPQKTGEEDLAVVVQPQPLKKNAKETSDRTSTIRRPKPKPSVSIVGLSYVDKIVEAVEQVLQGNRVYMLDFLLNPLKESPRLPKSLMLPKVRKNPLIEIIAINTGCLGDCTYCKTKQARGTLQSYQLPQIVERAKYAWVVDNCQQVWLTSEDTGAYGLDIVAPRGKMLRLGMTNPPYMARHSTKIGELLTHPNMFEFLHVPVQSGADAVLHNMNREYTSRTFTKMCSSILEKAPAMTLATDIICGFPGEKDADHVKTLELIEEFKFAVVNISQFYPRPGTKAADMKRVETGTVKARSTEVTEKFLSYTRNQVYEGRTLRVWWSDSDRRRNQIVGHTKQHVKVVHPFDPALLNTVTECFRVKKATKWHLEGEILHADALVAGAGGPVEAEARLTRNEDDAVDQDREIEQQPRPVLGVGVQVEEGKASNSALVPTPHKHKETQGAACSSSWNIKKNDHHKSSSRRGGSSGRKFVKENWDWVSDWVATSKFGNPVAERFLTLKTPVDPPFDSAIAEEDRFSCLDFFQAMDAAGHEISAVVNLTATTKYYCQTKNAEIIKQDPSFGATWGKDVEWLHYVIQGQKVPPMRQVNQVLDKMHNLFERHPEKKVAIHCTHGVNRTAFFVIAYLLRYGIYENLEAAKAHFQEQRSETIKRDYLSDGLQQLLPQILKREYSVDCSPRHQVEGEAPVVPRPPVDESGSGVRVVGEDEEQSAITDADLQSSTSSGLVGTSSCDAEAEDGVAVVDDEAVVDQLYEERENKEILKTVAADASAEDMIASSENIGSRSCAPTEVEMSKAKKKRMKRKAAKNQKL